MERLLDGYRRFRTTTWPDELDRYAVLAHKGQKPIALVIACSDSRVDPQTIFGAGPGELFVLRNVAALVPPYAPDAGYHGASAAIEYAVRVLKVPRAIVLGHAQCGGVQAAVQGTPPEAQDFVAPWLRIAGPALAGLAPGGDRLPRAEAAVIRLSLANLRTFPWLVEAEAEGRLRLGGFRFSIRSGKLERLEGDAMVEVN